MDEAATNAELIAAVIRKDSEAVARALGLGADPNALNNERSGRTAMMISVVNQDARVVEILLKQGADPNRCERIGPCWSALHLAVGERSLETVQVLLNGGADPDVCDFQGSPPLQYCLGRPGWKEIAWALINAGADRAIRDTDGMSVQDYADKNGWTEWLTPPSR